MNRTAPVAAVCLLAAGLTGCHGGKPEPTTVTESVTATTTNVVTVTPTPKATSPSPEASTESAPSATRAAAEPYVTKCLPGTPGPAQWSDGEVRYSEDCFQQLSGPDYLANEAQSGLTDSGQCVGPAAICGYGTAPNGAPNPSSGELQTQWGCQNGTINDSELCGAVESRIRAADSEGTTYP